MNRADLIRALAAHREAVRALENAIRADARHEYEANGSRAVWDIPGVAQVVSSVTHDHVEVVDQQAWLKWVQERYPHNVRMVPELINPDWGKQLLATLAEPVYAAIDDGDDYLEAFQAARDAGQVLAADGAVVPGLVFVKGGAFKTASVTVDRGYQRRLAKTAQMYAAGERGMTFGVEEAQEAQSSGPEGE